MTRRRKTGVVLRLRCCSCGTEILYDVPSVRKRYNMNCPKEKDKHWFKPVAEWDPAT